MKLNIDVGRDVFEESRLLRIAARRPELARIGDEFAREYNKFLAELERFKELTDEEEAKLDAMSAPASEYEALAAAINRIVVRDKAKLADFERRRAAIQAEMDECKEAEGELMGKT